MKIIWLLLITYTLSLAINSQVVVGSFLYENNAKIIKNSLQKYMIEDEKFYVENDIHASYKANGKYFIVSLAPIYDLKLLYATLNKMKPRFQGSYILELPIDSIETSAGEEEVIIIQEPKIEPKKEIIIQKVIKEKIIIKEEKSLFNQYQNEIIALILLLVLSNIYFIIKKPKSRENDSPQKLDEIEEISLNIEVKEFDSNKDLEIQEPSTEAVDILESDNFDGIEEGSFEVEEQQEEEKIIKPLHTKKTLIKKREVPSHTKITKQHFKEFAGLKILVAEDNLINQKVITGLLADTGIEITLADDGKEALDILERNSDFRFILMDAHMPRVDGFEATRIIKANSKYDHIIIVALSGDTAADDIKKMSEAGMQEHLEKPLRMDALYKILYAYTGNEYENDSSDFIEVIATKELNGDKGLEICGGDKEFYHEILNEFVDTYENSTNKLSELLNSGDLVQADKLLLDIIGVTSNIGADSLNSIAGTIKEALKDTQEKSYLTLLEQYKEHLEELIADIKEYI